MMTDSIALLRRLIAAPSPSRDESATADILFEALGDCSPRRIYNNVWCVNRRFDPSKPTLMLNSHHDTVRPAATWTIDPYTPVEKDGCIFGLGSNDAGASVVTLLALFRLWRDRTMPFNLLLALTAEEEVGGEHGMRAFLPHLRGQGIVPDCALVGEPTAMQAAVAERGLLVLDCTAHGVAGHAARNEGVNAIYKAIADIELLRSMTFPEVSPTLGPVKISVTQIEAGTQHNVVPDTCRFVVDVRTTDAYTNEQTVAMIRERIASDVRERSTRVQASVIDASHPLVRAAVATGCATFVSPTTSDMSLMHGLPSLKMGPGDSARSHKADEFVRVDELRSASIAYNQFLENLIKLY